VNSAILAVKLIVFTVILCFVAVKLPFKTSIRAISDLSKGSIDLLSDESLSDDESAQAMRKHSARILVETFKIAGFIAILVVSAVLVWFLLNLDRPFTAESFDVFYSLEGIAYSLLGIVVFIGIQKVMHRG
jgi:hypothetical protein